MDVNLSDIRQRISVFSIINDMLKQAHLVTLNANPPYAWFVANTDINTVSLLIRSLLSN